MNYTSEEERRRLLAAAYGREGTGLEPAQAQRLAELMQPQSEAPDGHSAERPITEVPDSAPALQRDSPPTPRARRSVVLIGAVAALAVAFAGGWVASSAAAPVPPTAAAMVSVGDSIATTRAAAQAAVASQADPDSLVYIGTIFDGVVWEARSADRATRCFALVSTAESDDTHRAEVVSCAAEEDTGTRLSSSPIMGDEYSAKEVVDAWWTDAQPARLTWTWVDVNTTTALLEPNAVVERTAQLVFDQGGPHATPVAVFGLTSLWAVERQDLHCVYVVTLVGPDADGSTVQQSSSCRDELVYGEQQIWTYPSDEFAPPAAPSGKYIRTVITWPAGQDPVATLRKE